MHLIGYIGSILIALSMTMRSIVRFRLINLAGASVFLSYGLLIGSLPVAMLNSFIIVVDIYYLVDIFSRREVFETMQVRNDNKYLKRFLEFYHDDIQRFFPGFQHKPELNTHSFFVLRNMAVAGLFLGRRIEGDILYVALDYVTLEYRDFKNGKFIFHRLREEMVADGFKKVVANGHSLKHRKYLEKLGFVHRDGTRYELQLI